MDLWGQKAAKADRSEQASYRATLDRQMAEKKERQAREKAEREALEADGWRIGAQLEEAGGVVRRRR